MATKLLIIFLMLFSMQTFAQDSYVMSWNSLGHTKYLVQKSSDNITWSTVTTLNAKLTDTAFNYTLPVPVKFKYYRVSADGLLTKAILVTNRLPILIFNIQLTPKIQLEQ